jgi:hypothetical protein
MRRTFVTAALLTAGAALGILGSIAGGLAAYGLSNGRVFEVSVLLSVTAVAVIVIVISARRFVR